MNLKLQHKPTGQIWKKTARQRAQTIRRVCETLKRTYGVPRLGNPVDPLDDLVYIILSNKTSPQMAVRTYERVKKRYPDWNELLKVRLSTLSLILEPGGLSNKKSRHIKSALKKINDDFGTCSLDVLKDRAKEEILEYLLSLPGVSEKVARCVMMYTLDMDVLPVDSHVFRVTGRLGWTERKRADQCHAELEALIPPHRRYAFHINCILHGRLICRPKIPSCDLCIIEHHCSYCEMIGKT